MIEVSTLVKTQFPEYIQAEGPNLIAFVEAYYEWFEQSDIIKGRDLSDLVDLDSTVDEFVTHFRSMYLNGLPSLTRGDLRQFIKRSKDFYEAKGTEKSIQLLLRLLYDVESQVYAPGDDVLRASAGDWHKPVYIEVTPEEANKDLTNQQIIGASSGARAIVESVVRRVTQGGYYDVLYLSSVTGSFQTSERVTASGSLTNAPVIIGSLNAVQILDGGKDNQVGDVFDVFSSSGKQGKARVVEVENGTGRVDFQLLNGGAGYSLDADAIVAEKMFAYNLVSGSGFQKFETVEQRLHKVQTISGNGAYVVGDIVNGYTSGTWILQGTGTVMQVQGNTSVANVTVQVANGDFRVATALRKSGNTVGSVIDTVTNVTATANVVGANSTYVGMFDIQQTFIQPATIQGQTSSTSAIVANVGTGMGAHFEIASIWNEESVLLATDFWSQRNSANVPYTSVGVDGSGSGVGFVSNVTITTAGTGYSNGAVVTFTGGGKLISSITITAAGTGYANGQLVVANGQSYSGNTLISLVTNGAGAITALNIVESGVFRSAPTLTVPVTSGTGATLTAVLGNPTTVATGTVTTAVGGAITSVSMPVQGTGYFSAPRLTVSGGTGAVLTPVMNYGYGLPKNIHGDLNSVINHTLTFENITAGTITGLKGIAPGQEYNTDPFVAVVEPSVAGLDRRDFHLTLSNTTGAFLTDEIVEQSISTPAIQLTLGAITGNSAFSINEVVTQASSSANGVVYYRDAGLLRLKDVQGTFTTGNPVVGSFSLATSTPSAANVTSQLLTAKGEVRAGANSSHMILRRTSINTNFNPSGIIVGRRSGATSTIASFVYDYQFEAMGNNAIVTANVKTANGIATVLEVVDSGYGYSQDENLQLVNPDNIFVISGRSQLERQGTGEGFWRSTAGFLNNDKHLHDGKYYQAFSYEVQTELSLDRYSEVLKKIVHVAGMKMFGKVVLHPTAVFDIETPTEITQRYPTTVGYDYNFAANTYTVTNSTPYLDFSE